MAVAIIQFCFQLTNVICPAAGQNCLREIPPALGMCASLRHLSLRDNRIQEVPMQVCGALCDVI